MTCRPPGSASRSPDPRSRAATAEAPAGVAVPESAIPPPPGEGAAAGGRGHRLPRLHNPARWPEVLPRRHPAAPLQPPPPPPLPRLTVTPRMVPSGRLKLLSAATAACAEAGSAKSTKPTPLQLPSGWVMALAPVGASGPKTLNSLNKSASLVSGGMFFTWSWHSVGTCPPPRIPAPFIALYIDWKVPPPTAATPPAAAPWCEEPLPTGC
mmetsp:Transcript_20713/g.51817  ORF Transcript_20713/g.51817 Transcript_20713/m.51817 type:complete len:210 (-) Transcript_20713:514-1143(-)